MIFDYRRHWLHILLGAIAIVLIVIFFPIRRLNGPSVKAPPIPASELALAAKITHVQGAVKLNGKSALEGQTVKSGDVVETGGNGEATIEFFSGARAALSFASRVTVEEAAVDANDVRIQRVRLAAKQGRIWSRVLKLLDNRSAYEVSLDGVVGGVRGTAFMVTIQQQYDPRKGIILPIILPTIIDQFDGKLYLQSATTSQLLVEGFSFRFPPGQLDYAQTFPTDDQTRNDPWVREQLRADAEFAKRMSDIRKKLGDDTDYSNIGNEAGPFTLGAAGGKHGDFRGVRIEDALQGTLYPGSIHQLKALAVFVDAQGKESTRDVTGEATWQISDPTLASIQKGQLILNKQPTGQFTVVARWNDGTHEHSGSVEFKISSEAAINVDTSATLFINGKPVK